MLTRGPDGFADRIETLANRGVQFVACNHSLQHLELRRQDLLHLVEVVPVWVSKLVKKQAKGWAYIRP